MILSRKEAHICFFFLLSLTQKVTTSFCLRGCYRYLQNGTCHIGNEATVSSLYALLDNQQQRRKDFVNSLKSSMEITCPENISEISVRIHTKLIVEMTKLFQADKIVLLIDIGYKYHILLSQTQSSLEQSLFDKVIEVHSLDLTNYHTLPRQIIGEIKNESKHVNRLNILLTSTEITHTLLEARVKYVLAEKQDLWLIPEENIVTAEYTPQRTFTFSPLECVCSPKKQSNQPLSYIKKVTPQGRTSIYIAFLSENETLCIDATTFSKKRPLVPVATTIMEPFLFTRMEEHTENEVKDVKRKMECRMSRDSDGPIKSHDLRGPIKTEKTLYCFGYIVDLLMKISEELLIDFDLYITDSIGYYASGNVSRPNASTSSGVLGELASGNALMGAGPITITKRRLNQVDFTTPFLVDDINIITLNEIAKTDKKSEFNMFSNLSHATQLSILAFWIASIIVVYVAENALQLVKRVSTDDRKYIGIRMINYVFKDCILYITGLVMQRDMGAKNPGTFGGRVISILFAFGMVCITTMYTASLTYQQVVHGGFNDFKGLQDKRIQHPTSDFKLATQSKAFLSDVFDASTDPVLKRLDKFMENYNTRHLNSGVQAIIDKEIHAYFMESSFAKYYRATIGQCKIMVHHTNLPSSYYGFVLPKGSPLTEEISQVIIQMHENEELLHLHSRWLRHECPTTYWKSTEKLTILFFKKLFVVLCIATGLAIIVLGGEMVYSKLAQTHDLQCMYRHSALQGMLEENEVLRRWLIPFEMEEDETLEEIEENEEEQDIEFAAKRWRKVSVQHRCAKDEMADVEGVSRGRDNSIDGAVSESKGLVERESSSQSIYVGENHDHAHANSEREGASVGRGSSDEADDDNSLDEESSGFLQRNQMGGKEGVESERTSMMMNDHETQ